MRRIRYLILISLSILLSYAAYGSSPYQPGVNLVSNPGFEDGKSNWSQNPRYWDVVTDVSHSGNNSIRISKTDPSTYPMIIQSLPVQKDARYVISAWIKTDSITGGDAGASIALDYYDCNNAYIKRGSYASVVTGTSDWTHVTYTSIKTPSNAAKVTIVLFMKNGCTGTAWFDDVNANLLYDYSFSAMILSPQYRNTVFPGQQKELVLGINAEGNAIHPIESLLANITVTSPSGSNISIKKSLDQNPLKWEKISLKINPDAGNYRITAELVDKYTGEIFASKNLESSILPDNTVMPKVYIDNQQRCIVDSKPFFPVGFYCSGNVNDVISYINRISESRFNCLMNYSTPYYPLDNIKLLLDTANSKNIKIIFSVKDCYDGSKYELKKAGPWVGSFNVLKGMVSTYKDYPSVLAWYLNDELTGQFLPQIKQRYDYIKTADPDHPVWQVLNASQDIADHADNTDVLGIDNYPVMNNTRNPKMNDFGAATSIAENASMRAKPVWMVGECSTIRYDGIHPSNRPPTYKEIMCEAYQGIINGARGLMFFNLSDLLRFDGENQWQIVKRAGDELFKIQPVMLGIDADTKQTSVSNPKISVLTRSVNDDLYVLAVNPYNVNIPVEFKIWDPKGASKAIEDPFNQNTSSITISNGKFTDTIESLGTRIYKLSR